MIPNAYFAPKKTTSQTDLENFVKLNYEKYNKVRFIFDLKNESVDINTMKKFSETFDKFRSHTLQKLVETCIIITDPLSASVFKKGLNMVRVDKPVKII